VVAPWFRSEDGYYSCSIRGAAGDTQGHRHRLGIVELLREKGASLRILNADIDTKGPSGKALLGMLLNPAVTVGLVAGGRFPTKEVGPYVISQVIGAIVAATVLYLIASGAPGFDLGKGFAANGYGEHSPGQYGLSSCLLAEIVLTMMFLFIIMGSTHGKAPVGFAPIAIGLGLTLIHLVGIPACRALSATSSTPASRKIRSSSFKSVEVSGSFRFNFSTAM
jgi:hypothetical protein